MENPKFEVKFLDSREKIPSAQNVSAVFLIALKEGEIVAIRNHRGWDLPAGHIEDKESIQEALRREVQEEASMTFRDPVPFVIVTSNSRDLKYKGKCMIGFATKEFTFSDFVPAPDSEERKLIPIEEFLSLYQQDKTNMKSMIEKAKNILDEKSYF